MTEKFCPECGCSISGEGYLKDGAIYCCEPCAVGEPCECDCICSKTNDMPDAETAEGGGDAG